MFTGCFTASITPMKNNKSVDYEGVQQLTEFQAENGVSGILACGTTGESPTLPWKEHDLVTQRIYEYLGDKGVTIAGTGSNSTKEMVYATKRMCDLGIKAVLLVDPYYNGPSSLEIRKEYIAPVAKRFPEIQIVPYIIPGRTGTQLLPQDVAILHAQFENIRAVKEATGNLENMKLTRKFCGEDLDILSGDDDKTYEMMVSPDILANGSISVISNIFPHAVQKMTQYINDKRESKAKEVYKTIKPMFELVTVKTYEETPYGPTLCKARNPLAYKTLMNILGMASGPCRQPLGKMTKKGIKIVLEKTRAVYNKNPELFDPVKNFFDVNVGERLYNKKYWENLIYD